MTSFLLPDLGDEFAAEMSSPRLLPGHDAAIGGDDDGADSAENARNVVHAGVDAESGPADAPQAVEHGPALMCRTSCASAVVCGWTAR